MRAIPFSKNEFHAELGSSGHDWWAVNSSEAVELEGQAAKHRRRSSDPGAQPEMLRQGQVDLRQRLNAKAKCARFLGGADANPVSSEAPELGPGAQFNARQAVLGRDAARCE